MTQFHVAEHIVHDPLAFDVIGEAERYRLTGDSRTEDMKRAAEHVKALHAVQEAAQLIPVQQTPEQA